MNAVLGLLWVLSGWLGGADDDAECLLLGGLDAVRAEAFTSADAARLREVYIDARAARADTATLRVYRERGLRLEGMRLVRESCRVTSRSPDRLVLAVVDRLGPTWARAADGRRHELPRDRPSGRTVVLERVGEAWRIAEVRAG